MSRSGFLLRTPRFNLMHVRPWLCMHAQLQRLSRTTHAVWAHLDPPHATRANAFRIFGREFAAAGGRGSAGRARIKRYHVQGSGNGVESTSTTEGHTLRTDLPRMQGGQDTAPQPVHPSAPASPALARVHPQTHAYMNAPTSGAFVAGGPNRL